MSTIRDTRLAAGVGVRELARRTGVTPAAVLAWEASEERGTIQSDTRQRAIDAIGPVPAAPPPSYSQRFSRELHRRIAMRLVEDPTTIVRTAAANLPRLRSQVSGAAGHRWIDEWASKLDAERLGPLVDLMLADDEHARSLRQVSPFMGILTSDERNRALEAAR